MAVFASVRRPRMSLRFTARRSAIVTAEAGAGYIRVIEVNRRPVGRHMATVAVGTGR